ncbi:hypothetical protein PV11_06724 [Exophiala sideris]|uniref:Uncharacterized protein n=1 Tax=Exophiala sideris TaxID=1016849 RepID=A0A0D1YED2_9EURO|nr:hypothetical protein PV11_06724 [Exophiala sideris]
MVLRKQYPSRDYETFSEDTEGQTPRTSDKSRSAAAEAQRLGSMGSWADNFAGNTPATNLTPTASTVDGNEVRDVPYPQGVHELEPSDPPPQYTPSDSTAVQTPTTPSSPLTSRYVPPQAVTVSAPASDTPLPASHVQQSYRDDDDEGAASLPEPVQHEYNPSHHHHHGRGHDESEEAELGPSCNRGPRGRGCWKRHHRGRSRGCRGRRGGSPWRKERGRRFKRLCWFTVSLVLCLWLMIPGLYKSISNKDRSQYPIVSPEPAAPSWPPFPKREHREHETFRSISGTYELYDLLDLSTTSGSISIRVDVQEGEKPATLRLSSLAGSVNVRFATGGGFMSKATLSPAAASRTLNIEISTHAGSISGDLLHGNGGSTVLSSQAGSVSVRINTVGVSELDPPSKISVSTWSGSQNVEVRAPFSSTEAVRAIEATHKVTSSGSMSINYPTAWEGMVHVKSLGSGSVGASGRGLVVQKESSRELYGYRGMKEGRTIEIFEEGSGSVNFRC